MRIGEVAVTAGVSVRTLHHWDAVGLLVPSGRTASGYRTYDAGDLARLQRVLTYRELGFELEQVRQLLDDPTVDALDHLRRQRTLLADRIARLQSDAFAQSQARTSSYDEQDWLRVKAADEDLERRFAEALAAGEPADGQLARDLAEERRQGISRDFYDCSLDRHTGLADMHVADERFTQHYERRAEGLPQYVHDAVHRQRGSVSGLTVALPPHR